MEGNIENIKVSVVMPTYKRSEYLIRAIESVLGQKYKNIEVVVVDDNGKNNDFRYATEEKMKRYEGDTRVKYIKNDTNIGGGLSRNVGISNCEGEYISFLDDDDIYLPNKVINQLEYMIIKNIDVCFTNLKLHNNDDKLVDYREFSFIKSFKNKELLKYHLTKHITGTPTFMYKKDVLKFIGGFRDVKVSQEFYLMLDTIEYGAKIGYLNKSDVIAYKHDGEKISNGKNKINGEKLLYENKVRYFNDLSSKDINFIKFRHKSIMAISYFRNKQYGKFFVKSIEVGICFPVTLTKEVISFVKKIMDKSSSEEIEEYD